MPKLASSGCLGFRIERLNDEHSANHILLVGRGLRDRGFLGLGEVG